MIKGTTFFFLQKVIIKQGKEIAQSRKIYTKMPFNRFLSTHLGEHAVSVFFFHFKKKPKKKKKKKKKKTHTTLEYTNVGEKGLKIFTIK